jgi:predicted ArsR family transcriptional regulator
VRRELFFYVCNQDHPVSREEAARALDINRELARFHLNHLEAEGLLEARFERPPGRRGPGAGRPARVYRRSSRRVHLSLPPRSYHLLATILLRAMKDSEDQPLAASVSRSAHAVGKVLGMTARESAKADETLLSPIDRLEAVVARNGFQPVREIDGTLRLRNCPFHEAVAEDRERVCAINHAFMRGIACGLEAEVEAVLDPGPGRCCVSFRPPHVADKVHYP